MLGINLEMLLNLKWVEGQQQLLLCEKWVNESIVSSIAPPQTVEQISVKYLSALKWIYQHYVTYYCQFLLRLNTSHKWAHQVSKEGKSHLISGGNSGYSWVLVCALDLLSERGAAGYNAGWGGGMMGEPDGSSTFAVDVKLVSPSETHSLWRIQTLSLSTAFIVTPKTGCIYYTQGGEVEHLKW